MATRRAQVLNIGQEPDGPPTIERSPEDGLYWIQWERPSVAVMLSEENLRALVTGSMIAEAQAATASRPSTRPANPSTYGGRLAF